MTIFIPLVLCLLGLFGFFVRGLRFTLVAYYFAVVFLLAEVYQPWARFYVAYLLALAVGVMLALLVFGKWRPMLGAALDENPHWGVVGGFWEKTCVLGVIFRYGATPSQPNGFDGRVGVIVFHRAWGLWWDARAASWF